MTGEEFNKKVEEWHLGAGEGQELHEYLGMAWEEYKSYLVPIPQALLDEIEVIGLLAAQNRKRERMELAIKAYKKAKDEGTIRLVGEAKPNNLSVEQAFAIGFERYQDTLEELADK